MITKPASSFCLGFKRPVAEGHKVYDVWLSLYTHQSQGLSSFLRFDPLLPCVPLSILPKGEYVWSAVL